jgi:hypothetical protein
MRKIEKDMMDAINNCRTWHGANTSVSSIDDVNCAVFLHGNHIADVNSRTGLVMVNKYTLAKWPTNTTKSRLRALGANVTTKNGSTFLDGIAITAEAA